MTAAANPQVLFITLPWLKRKPATVSARKMREGLPYALALAQREMGDRISLHGYAFEPDAARFVVSGHDGAITEFTEQLNEDVGVVVSGLRGARGRVFRDPRVELLRTPDEVLDCLVEHRM